MPACVCDWDACCAVLACHPKPRGPVAAAARHTRRLPYCHTRRNAAVSPGGAGRAVRVLPCRPDATLEPGLRLLSFLCLRQSAHSFALKTQTAVDTLDLPVPVPAATAALLLDHLYKVSLLYSLTERSINSLIICLCFRSLQGVLAPQTLDLTNALHLFSKLP